MPRVRDVPTRRLRAVPVDPSLVHSELAEERRLAVEALGRLADAPAIELLVGCLLDPDVDVTYDAASALADIGTDRAIDGLLEVAGDERCDVARRVVAVSALGHLRVVPPRVIDALRTLHARGDRGDGGDPWLVGTARQTLLWLERD